MDENELHVLLMLGFYRSNRENREANDEQRADAGTA